MYQSMDGAGKKRVGHIRLLPTDKVAVLQHPDAGEYDRILDAIDLAEAKLDEFKADLKRPDLKYIPFRSKDGIIHVRIELLQESENPFNSRSELPPYFDLLLKAYSSAINRILRMRTEHPVGLSAKSLEFRLVN